MEEKTVLTPSQSSARERRIRPSMRPATWWWLGILGSGSWKREYVRMTFRN